MWSSGSRQRSRSLQRHVASTGAFGLEMLAEMNGWCAVASFRFVVVVDQVFESSSFVVVGVGVVIIVVVSSPPGPAALSCCLIPSPDPVA